MLRYVVWSKLKQFVFHYVGRGLILFTLFVNFSGGTRISALIFKEVGAGLWTMHQTDGKLRTIACSVNLSSESHMFDIIVPRTVRLELPKLVVALPILYRMIFMTPP